VRNRISRFFPDEGSSAGQNDGMQLTADEIRRAPTVLLHDHLDGGLRPQTIVELARQNGSV
jgi:adenosine deaminase